MDRIVTDGESGAADGGGDGGGGECTDSISEKLISNRYQNLHKSQKSNKKTQNFTTICVNHNYGRAVNLTL